MKCSEPGCLKDTHRRTLCSKHYSHWLRATPFEDRRPLTVLERFWSKCVKGEIPSHDPGLGECLIWTDAINPNGYGVFHPGNGKTIIASRFALSLALGRNVDRAMFACHKCDNPPCVNPTHMYEGTHQQNVDDSVARDRHKRGSRGSIKLKDADVLEIRSRAAEGVLLQDLAAEYGVNPSMVTQIVRGDRWKSVGGPVTNRYNKNRKAS